MGNCSGKKIKKDKNEKTFQESNSEDNAKLKSYFICEIAFIFLIDQPLD